MSKPPTAGAADSSDPFGNPLLDGGVIAVHDACANVSCMAEPGAREPDDDGWSTADGDCNDEATLVNPGAFDVPGNGIDDDCQAGDATESVCDAALDIASNDPLDAARAMDLCQITSEDSKRWGVISAHWTTPDGRGEPGSNWMHGLLPAFGPSFASRAGERLLALSSGVARAPDQEGYTQDCGDRFPVESGAFPPDFDGSSMSCEVDEAETRVVDAIALELRVRMPTNVSAVSFDSAFFTHEYPHYICTPYNDFFQVLVQPKRLGSTADGNVVFDREANAVSVNNSLLGVCTPGTHGNKEFECPLGYEPLVGTGFDDCDIRLIDWPGFDLFGRSERGRYGASTGWINTEFAVTPGEIVTFRFAIWDSSDSWLDSLAIIDNFRFRLRTEPPPPEKPMTMPVGPD